MYGYVLSSRSIVLYFGVCSFIRLHSKTRASSSESVTIYSKWSICSTICFFLMPSLWLCLKVLMYSLRQAFGFADIYDYIIPVMHNINSRASGVFLILLWYSNVFSIIRSFGLWWSFALFVVRGGVSHLQFVWLPAWHTVYSSGKYEVSRGFSLRLVFFVCKAFSSLLLSGSPRQFIFSFWTHCVPSGFFQFMCAKLFSTALFLCWNSFFAPFAAAKIAWLLVVFENWPIRY